MRTTLSILALTIVIAGCRNVAPEPAAQPPSTASSQRQTPTPLSGIGNHHHSITTASPEAQKAFDQGFNLVFGFNHEEAVRSFKRATELDPKAPMPHWGIAWALGLNYNFDVDDERGKQANAAIAQALELSQGRSDVERAYIEAMAIRFPTDAKPDRVALARSYSEAMGNLSHRFPDDLDAATLYAESLMNLRAWKLWSLNGTPADRTPEIVAVLESVPSRIALAIARSGIVDAMARSGKSDGAAEERTAFARASASVPKEALFGGTGLESAGNILALATTVLDARIAWARGARADAIKLWTSAVARADAVPYDEPPIFFYPVRESLGAALLLNGKFEDAERVFRADLVKHPRNARSLFGLHESLLKQGKTADAAWVKRAFEDAWKDAETTLTVEAL